MHLPRVSLARCRNQDYNSKAPAEPPLVFIPVHNNDTKDTQTSTVSLQILTPTERTNKNGDSVRRARLPVRSSRSIVAAERMDTIDESRQVYKWPQ